MEASKHAVSPPPKASVTDVFPPLSLDLQQPESVDPTDNVTNTVCGFAQTRPPDDLFNDDFTPISEPPIEEVHHDTTGQPSTSAQNNRGRGQHRGRNPASRSRPRTDVDSRAPTEVAEESPDQPSKAPAVRGDRSGTGGIKKAKLTEDELSARMEAVKLKNASLEAAYARAEADEASFQAREAQAQEKQKIERQNRQQLMGERESNRNRKLNAAQGRDWDAKKGEDYTGNSGREGQSQFRRGAHGGVVAAQSSESNNRSNEPRLNSDLGGYSGRGGFRARDRGRGRGRGGLEAFEPAYMRRREQSVTTESDFPALATTASARSSKEAISLTQAPTTNSTVASSTLNASSQPFTPQGGSWAEQMEASA